MALARKAGRLKGLPALVRTALLADVLDSLGYRAQCLGVGIAAINPTGVMIGRAFTVVCRPVSRPPARRYVGLLRALDSISRDEVFVLATGRARGAAFFGELCGTACLAKEAAGALTDGPVRDRALLAKIPFPVFATAALPLDIHGRYEVARIGKPVAIDGVTIRSGDLIVGDEDGVVVVPAEIESEAISLASEKASKENLFRKAVAAGMQPSKAYEAFGVL